MTTHQDPALPTATKNGNEPALSGGPVIARKTSRGLLTVHVVDGDQLSIRLDGWSFASGRPTRLSIPRVDNGVTYTHYVQGNLRGEKVAFGIAADEAAAVESVLSDIAKAKAESPAARREKLCDAVRAATDEADRATERAHRNDDGRGWDRVKAADAARDAAWSALAAFDAANPTAKPTIDTLLSAVERGVD